MTVYNYKGLNAHTISDKVIAREDAMRNVDRDSLSLMEKCRFIRAQLDSGYPSIKDKSLYRLKLQEIKPELMSLAKAGDRVAMFYLSVFFVSDPVCNREWLDGASDEDYPIMAMCYLREAANRDMTEQDYQLALSLEKLFSSLPDDEMRLRGLMRCHYFIAAYEGKSKLERAEAVREERVALASLGSYATINSLMLCASRRVELAKTEEERLDATEEWEFWCTVAYLVMEHYAKQGNKRHCFSLAHMLYEGRGCEQDVEASINYDVESLLYLGSLLSEDGARRLRERNDILYIVNPVGAAIVKACLDGDREALYAAVAEASRTGNRGRIKKADFHIRNAIHYDFKCGES